MFFSPSSLAKSIDGAALAQKVYDRDNGKDSYAIVKMLLINKRGKKRLRTMITATKDYRDLTKNYIRFTSPASIKDTSFLTWENADRDDDQFLYLPALRRVRRIVSSQKKNRFVNTDYTYEDLERRAVIEDNHTILKIEKYAQHECWVLESIPKNLKNTQYSRRVSWIVKDIYIPIKTEYYDKKGRLCKKFYGRRLKKIDGIWTVMEAEMHDLKKKHRTLMKYSGLKYNQGIPDKVFTKAYMIHAE